MRPLFYRRVLAADDLAALSARFTATFGTWYGGVCDCALGLPYRTYHVPLDPVLAAVLRPLLPPRVFEWNEVDDSVEQDVSEISFERSEACWFAADLAWMVYASHEATLTIAGDALVRDVERRAPPGPLAGISVPEMTPRIAIVLGLLGATAEARPARPPSVAKARAVANAWVNARVDELQQADGDEWKDAASAGLIAARSPPSRPPPPRSSRDAPWVARRRRSENRHAASGSPRPIRTASSRSTSVTNCHTARSRGACCSSSRVTR